MLSQTFTYNTRMNPIKVRWRYIFLCFWSSKSCWTLSWFNIHMWFGISWKSQNYRLHQNIFSMKTRNMTVTIFKWPTKKIATEPFNITTFKIFQLEPVPRQYLHDIRKIFLQTHQCFHMKVQCWPGAGREAQHACLPVECTSSCCRGHPHLCDD